MRIPKISVIGAGNVGGACAAALAARRLGTIYLYDVVEDRAVGKAMDVNHASPFFRTSAQVIGCNSLAELKDSDVAVITAGAPRRAGMTRRDLLQDNFERMLEVGQALMEHCPGAKVLAVTNPVDILTWVLKDRWAEMDVFGLGCSLDTVRFRYFLAEAARASVESVSGLVIGAHDNNMVPLVKHATVGGVGVDHLLSPGSIARVVTRTREAGNAIVRRLKTTGSFYAASYTIAEIVEAVVRNTRSVFPLSVYCSGQYGYYDTCLALPALVGSNGVEMIVDIDLDEEERTALAFCAAGIAEGLGALCPKL